MKCRQSHAQFTVCHGSYGHAGAAALSYLGPTANSTHFYAPLVFKHDKQRPKPPPLKHMQESRYDISHGDFGSLWEIPFHLMLIKPDVAAKAAARRSSSELVHGRVFPQELIINLYLSDSPADTVTDRQLLQRKASRREETSNGALPKIIRLQSGHFSSF
ncbi:unnamed protein product [Pleuronectes platessa]|uniref:Uncharacterized protein n=1 Tax=Pleuronectes platessa TaxID=8262 RepID=A0A9N7VA73_PLEPL|nr:unnamed protein product [Pleuronectes platessa]